MSMMSDSIADSAKTIRASWTSTSASRDGGERPLLAHDGFDDLEVAGAAIGPERRFVAVALRTRERTDGLQVRRAAVGRIVRSAGARNPGQLRLDRERFGQRRHL